MSRKDELEHNLGIVQERILAAAEDAGRATADITLIVVTKTFPTSDAELLYELGVREMGENRDEEGALKSEHLPLDVRWHFQGQVQGRKIKSISGWADVVHSLDSTSHARKFDLENESKVKEFFIQINLEPERKDRGGVAPAELASFVRFLGEETDLKVSGLMTVAPLHRVVSEAFSELKKLQSELLGIYPEAVALSMGMSGDFEEAIRAGATHLRIGSAILGSRALQA
jgi:PLP dependent protein